MTAIIELARRLPTVSHFEFTATPGPQSSTGWRGSGRGRVEIESVESNVRFLEAGEFKLAGHSEGVAIRNVYRWQTRESAVSLWHERRGSEAAVHLFELVSVDEHRLESQAGHQCAADLYRAVLDLQEWGFTLRWRIEGPRKDETIAYRYFYR